jgi:IS1 family transposase
VSKLPESEEYETDNYWVYKFLPFNKHRIRKYGRVNRNESLHSSLRSYLACMRRKTKAFCKTMEALQRNLFLFFAFHLLE